jgi:hypothetical protein
LRRDLAALASGSCSTSRTPSLVSWRDLLFLEALVWTGWQTKKERLADAR